MIESQTMLGHAFRLSNKVNHVLNHPIQKKSSLGEKLYQVKLIMMNLKKASWVDQLEV